MKNKIIGIIIIGLLLAPVLPCAQSTVNTVEQEEETLIYTSRIMGIGLARINSFTHTIFGFVLYGIHNGEIISMQFINIKYEEADELFAGFMPLVFYIRYNPAL